MPHTTAGAVIPSDHSLSILVLGFQIVWINILLSGDNALVIALACRDLDERRRKWAILGGSAVAVTLRIVLTFFVVSLLELPAIKLLSGVLLIWIAVDLLRRDGDEKNVAAAGSIWGAVRTIVIADAVMSLDNVVAVAAAAKNSIPLIAFGIALSVPLIVFGSTFVLALLRRFPSLVIAGAALLGWIAGEIMASDVLLPRVFGALPPDLDLWIGAGTTALMLAVAAILRFIRRRRGQMPRGLRSTAE